MRKLFIALVLLSLTSCFEDTKKLLEKCADATYKKSGYGTLNLKLELKKKMLQSASYEGYYKYCEDELKKNPSAFNVKYGK